MLLDGIKGVIFDLGSTLIEFENRTWPEMRVDGHRRGYNLLTGNGHKLPDFETYHRRTEEIKDEFRVHARETLEEWVITDAFERVLREYGIIDDSIGSKECADALYSAVRDQLTVCEGAAETLEMLKARGYRIGLISNTIFLRSQHEADLDLYGLTPFLEFRVYSSEFGYRKPHGLIFEEGLRQIKLPAESVVYVGDRYFEDVQGAREAGLAAVLKYREGRDYPDPMPPDFPVIRELGELLEILDM